MPEACSATRGDRLRLIVHELIVVAASGCADSSSSPWAEFGMYYCEWSRVLSWRTRVPRQGALSRQS